MFKREELWDIRRRAKESAKNVPNPDWKRAFLHLADGADRLDAMIARTEFKGITIEE